MKEWHVPDDVMMAFSANSGAMPLAAASSIEQHLTACASCRARLAGITPRSELDLIWAEVQDGVDRVGAGATERLLQQLRVESGPARLIAATPALRIGAMLAVSVIVAAVVLVSRAADVGEAFLVLAPVVPTGLVALSFAPGVDPAGECGLATPVFGFGLVVRRAVAVELLALLVLAVGSVFVPMTGLRAVGWLAPALALSLGTLSLSARWAAPRAAAGVTVGWAAVLVVAYVGQGGRDLAETIVFAPPGQITLGLVAVGALMSTALNRQVLFQEVSR